MQNVLFLGIWKSILIASGFCLIPEREREGEFQMSQIFALYAHLPYPTFLNSLSGI